MGEGEEEKMNKETNLDFRVSFLSSLHGFYDSTNQSVRLNAPLFNVIGFTEKGQLMMWGSWAEGNVQLRRASLTDPTLERGERSA